MDTVALAIIVHALLSLHPEDYTVEDRKSLLGYKLSSDAAWLLLHLKKELDNMEKHKRKRRKSTRL